jgi:hypothetical protein
VSDLPQTPPPNAPAEPLISVGTITAVVAALVAAGIAFGLHITDDQKGTLLTLVGLVAPLVVDLIGRTKVFSPRTVRAMLISK